MLDITRQGYNRYVNKEKQEFIESDFIISKVNEIRQKHPKMGGRKLYFMIKPEMQKAQIKMGRDNFFKILKENNLLSQNWLKPPSSDGKEKNPYQFL